MIEAKTLVGLDVHATKTVAAILDAQTGELRFDRLGGEVAAVADLCRRVPGPVRRGKRRNVAAARELAGFCWAIARIG